MAKKTSRKDTASAMKLTQELRHPWLMPVLAVFYFFVTCLMLQGCNKGITMLLLLAAVAAIIVAGERLGQRMTWPALLLGLYVLMDGISTLYAPSGKFALYEFLKVAAAACMALLLTALEPERPGRTGRCAATVLETAGALASLVSIDMVSTQLLYKLLNALTAPLGAPVLLENVLQEQRLKTIFENPNVFAGCAGVAILLALGLAVSTDDKKERCLHLSCLLLNSTAFLLAVSRGAMAAVAAAFLVYLLLERGQRRAISFVLMVETLVLSGAAALCALPAYAAAGQTIQVLPLLAVLAAAATLCMLDIFVGRPLALRMARRMKTVNIVLLAALGAVVLLAAAAVSWTGAITMQSGERITRGAYLGEGEYTLRVDADGPVKVTVQTQTQEDAVMNRKQTVYKGEADGAVFAAPADNRSVTFQIRADETVHISSIRYEGTASGELKLKYKLLPEAIAGRIQTLRSEGNVVQRLVYIKDAMQLFRRSPVVGLGMGAFENGIYNVQSYHYETKYVHNHYVQTMVDTGVIGLALWLGLLGTSAAAVIRQWRRERTEAQTMAPALGALLLFLMIHAAVEVIFSSGYFLPFGLGALAVINLTCGQMLPLRWAGGKTRRWMVRAEGLGLVAFVVLLTMNLWAAQLARHGTYDAAAQAAELDPYEWADHKLAYVYNASAEEALPENMQETLARYMADLEKLNSNAVPKYLAEAYFNLGNVEKGFAMLEKYVDYTSSDPNTWDISFRIVMQHSDGSEAFRQGAAQLRDKLERWNQQNLGAITLSEDVTAYLTELLGDA
mgnify:FL=1